MKFSDAVVGLTYRVKTNSWVNQWRWLDKQPQPLYDDLKIWKDEKVTCVLINKAIKKSWYKNEQGRVFSLTNHTILEPLEKVKGDRETRKNKLEKVIKSVRKEVGTLLDKLEKAQKTLTEKEEELEQLNKFKTDEEELAHQLSEMIRQGNSTEVKRLIEKRKELFIKVI